MAATRSTHPALLAAVLLGTLLTACAHQGKPGSTHGLVQGGGASCAAPQLAARPFRVLAPSRREAVRPGERLRLHGRFFTHDCFDSGPAAGRRDRPATRVLLDLIPAGGHPTSVGVAHPSGPASGFAVTIRIPRSTGAGSARIVGRGIGGVLLLDVRAAAN